MTTDRSLASMSVALPNDSTLSPASPWGFSRYSIAGALLSLGIVAVVALVIAASHSGGSAHRSKRNAPHGAGVRSGAVAVKPVGDSGVASNGVLEHTGSGSSGAGSVTKIAEERDPEEAKSFPVSASVTAHHQAAKAPSAASEAAIAPGALSEAQVRRELHEEAAAQTQEQTALKRVLTPEKGGFSVGGNGTIPIPSDVPEAVARVVAGGNAIADFPYIWGGGHASFIASGYDCSGSVSYALAAGGLLSAPLVSGELAHWGDPGPGRWITIYANAGHTFMNVDGVWFDTAGRSGPYASRWLVSTPPLEGYAVRHPPGL
jgi:cell wall-associated NlpC family hydrolase